MAGTLKLEVVVHPIEVDGDDTKPKGGSELKMKPHWNVDQWVCLSIGDRTITVSAKELDRALRACQQ